MFQLKDRVKDRAATGVSVVFDISGSPNDNSQEVGEF
jgi:hypothetical protein